MYWSQSCQSQRPETRTATLIEYVCPDYRELQIKRSQDSQPPGCALAESWNGQKYLGVNRIGSSQTWLFQTWLFASFFTQTEALFCALLRSFVDLRLRSFALICVFLRPTTVKTLEQPRLGTTELSETRRLGASEKVLPAVRANRRCNLNVACTTATITQGCPLVARRKNVQNFQRWWPVINESFWYCTDTGKEDSHNCPHHLLR